jgi:Raf kinase inhibitor-like YbhB/YbcL family protein
MRLSSPSLVDGERIPVRHAFATAHPETRVTLSDNVNPALEWSEVPEGTKSFAVICHDPDVPSRPDDVNQEGREVPEDLPRVDFFHWVAVDLPADTRRIDEGQFSQGVVAGGQQVAQGPLGCRQGINDYTGWFAGDETMAGTYFGYDGPAPPWNDSLIHRYVFTVYALDVERLPVADGFTGPDAIGAMEGHVLGQSSLTCTYTQNPRLLG